MDNGSYDGLEIMTTPDLKLEFARQMLMAEGMEQLTLKSIWGCHSKSGQIPSEVRLAVC